MVQAAIARPSAPRRPRPLALVKAQPPPPAPHKNIATARGYAREDLYVIAEIAYHYLMNGGLELARVLFEGLQAVAPDEAYFALGLGLTHDRLSAPEVAGTWYTRAAELDPADGRPDVNRAELLIERGEIAEAVGLLKTGADKARARGESALERKARAILKTVTKARGTT